MRIFKRLITLCLLALPFNLAYSITFPPPPPSYSCIWFQDSSSNLHQVRADTTEVSLNTATPTSGARVMAMNSSDCGAWVLDSGNLYQFDSAGVLLQQISPHNYDATLGVVFQGTLDAYDKSLWLSDGVKMLHISDQAVLLGEYAIPAGQGLAPALDQGFWTLDKSRISHYSRSGTLIANYNLAPPFWNWGGIKFVVDSVNGKIWASQTKYLARMDISSPSSAPVVFTQPGNIQALTINSESGTVWLIANDVLYNLDASGGLLYSLNLAPINIIGVTTLSFDPTTRSLWAISPNFLSRFTATGIFTKNLPTITGKALVTPAFLVTPMVSLVQPEPNALTNNPSPIFTLDYEALCNNQLCSFASSYFASYSLIATLNSKDVGTQFIFNPPTHQANFTPPYTLADGIASFVGSVKDSFGHSSPSISGTFTVDTIPPTFTRITPADNTVVTNPNVKIQGSVDDLDATVIFSNLQNWSGTGANPATQNFNWALTLNTGLNGLNVSAIDRAGNIRLLTLHLTYAPPPVGITISSPVSGTTVADGQVTVTGTFTGPPNTGVIVNGQASATSGNQFSASVSLQSGSNTLTATATAPNGTKATQSINVTSSGVQPVSISANQVEGMAPLGVSFTLSSNLTVPIKNIDWDFQGSVGLYSSVSQDEVIPVSYITPGVYQIKAIITDNLNNTYQTSLPIVVRSYSELADSLRATYNGMLGDLRAGNIEAALTVVMPSVVEKYRTVFTSLGASLPAVVNDLGTFQDGTISNGFAEFSVIRNSTVGTEVYPITFMRGDDGVWRIDGM